MQVKKIAIYNSICDAALKEFYTKGYEKSTMRSISKTTGITLGNIYRYFPSKISLFEEVIGETYKGFFSFLEDYKEAHTTTENNFTTGEILEKYFKFDRKRIYILLYKSQGTKFGSFEEKSTDLLANVSSNLAAIMEKRENIVIVDDEIHRFIATTLIQSIKSMTSLFEDEKTLKNYLEKLLDGQLTDLIRKLGYKNLH